MARRLAVTALLAAAACVDGEGPVAPDDVRTVRIAAAPVFAVAPSVEEAARLTRARVSVLDAATGTLIASVTEDVDPAADQWVLEVTVEVTEGKPLSVLLDTELASVLGGVESVEWSGRTDPFRLVAGMQPLEIRAVRLYPGPLDNLEVTEIRVEGVPTSVLEGEVVHLRASALGGGAGARVSFRSENTTVASVDGSGRVETFSEGTAHILAEAGPVSEAIAFEVRAVALPEPEEIDRAVGPQIDFTASAVVGTLADPTGAAAIASALGSLESALAGGQGADAVRAFGEARDAWAAYGAGTALRVLDGPQLGIVELTLIVAADALGIAFQ